MRNFLTYIVAFLFGTQLFALDAKEVQKYFDNTIFKIRSLSVEFTDNKNKANSGTLKAMKGNKYRIDTKDRIIICDGKKISNYAVKERKVIVSSFDEDRAGVSIETIFFDLLKNAEIQSLASEAHSKIAKNALYSVAIKLSSAEKKKHKIDNLKLIIDDKMQVKQLSFTYKGDRQEITINKFTLNPKLKDKDFKLKIPKNVEQIEID